MARRYSCYCPGLESLLSRSLLTFITSLPILRGNPALRFAREPHVSLRLVIRKYVNSRRLGDRPSPARDCAVHFPFVGKAACADASRLAWAAEENGSGPGTPAAPHEVQTAPTNSSLQAQPGESGYGTQQELQTAPTSSSPALKPPESGPGTQQELQTAPTGSSPPKPEENRQETTFVDVLHGKMSERLLTTAAWMDSFFRDENYVKEVNQSYVRFRYDMFKEERFPRDIKTGR